jgi:hypothetical protein
MLDRTLLRLQQEGGEQGRKKKKKKKKEREVTLFLVFCIPLFIITSTDDYLFVHSFSLFFFAFIYKTITNKENQKVWI